MSSPYFIAFLITIIAAVIFVVLYLRAQAANHKIEKELTSKLNETASQLQVTGEKLKLHQEQANQYQHQVKETSSALTEARALVAGMESRLKSTQERLQEFDQRLNEQSAINRQQQADLHQHQQLVTELRVLNDSLKEKLQTQKEEIVRLQHTAQLEFEKIAQKLLEEKAGKFTESNRQNIEALLKPLNDNIAEFKKKVEETYHSESKERHSLQNEIKNLVENAQRISQEANNLASALKGQKKLQGNWGETILESILEASGLVKDREYFIQETIRDEAGNALRPDVIVRLPDDRSIVIDSKVSLNAYLRFNEADTPELQQQNLDQHIQAIKTHIDQLSERRYDEFTGSLDFVIMFVPIEPAYMLAVQRNSDLWGYAYNKRILLISPTNLIAVLKIIADLWKRELQNKNAVEIARQGSKLYDKFTLFLATLEDVGKNIKRSQESYDKAVNQLKEGRGNLIRQAEQLRSLGIKSEKNLPASFLTDGEPDDEPEDNPGV